MDLDIAYLLLLCCKAANMNFSAEDAGNPLGMIKGYVGWESRGIDSYQALFIEFADYVVVAFRNSDECLDWRANLDLCKVRGFHRGFFVAASLLAPDVVHYLCRLNKPFYLTGHSLGGAVATILSCLLPPDLPRLGTYVFATPRLADKSVGLDDMLGDNYFSYVRTTDLFPYLPFGLGYTFPTNLYRIDRENEMTQGSLKVWDLFRLNPFNLISEHELRSYAKALSHLRRKGEAV